MKREFKEYLDVTAQDIDPVYNVANTYASETYTGCGGKSMTLMCKHSTNFNTVEPATYDRIK